MIKKEKVKNKALAIFIKNPELGKAKTRIAKDSSDEIALSIYSKLLNITRTLCNKVKTNRYVFYSQFIDESDEWTTNSFNKKLQGGSNLGEKMSNGFQVLFTEQYNKVLLIGSDCPYITEEIINEAYSSLDKHDFVFGPTYDGGYYLIGMKEFRPIIFSNIEWSTEHVLNKSLERAASIGCKYHLLPTLQDIDHLDDWEKYKSLFN